MTKFVVLRSALPQPRLPVGRKGGLDALAAYDLNPTPTDVRARILTTAIAPDAYDCDIGLARDVAGDFNLSDAEARTIIRSVAAVTATWRAAAEARGARGRKSGECRAHLNTTT